MLSSISSTYGGLYNYAGLYGTSPLSSVYAASGQSGFGAAAPSLYNLGQQAESYQVKLSGYGQLRSAADTLNAALDKLKTNAGVAPYKATSSSEAVLTATASAGVASAGTYSVAVSQLATAQTLTSAPVADANSTIVGSGSLTIRVGSYNSSQNTFSPGTSPDVTVNIATGNGTLGGIASAINNAKAGVKATIVQAQGGGYQLQLTASNTGTDNTVKITAKDASGNLLLTNAGLGQLSFDPTVTAANGKNLSETAAQNALLTVDGKPIISQSNAVSYGIDGVTLNLAATGTSAVQVGVNRDATAFSASVKGFVDAYNSFQKSVSDLSNVTSTSANPPLPNDALTAQLGKSVSEAVKRAAAGFGNARLSFADLGVVRQTDGSLTLDSSKLQSAFSANPDSATALVSSAANKLSSVLASNTASTSALQYTTQALQRSIQSVNTNKSVLQNYSSPSSFFGQPFQYSQFSYLLSSIALNGVQRYSQVSKL
ncbi:MAG: flagellar filament capping protein FliD [Burkholderiales bacterium]